MSVSKTLVEANIESISPYIPGKPIEEVQRELGIDEIVKLASNESPLGPSPLVEQAVAKHAGSVHRYPDASAHRLRLRMSAELGVPPNHLTFGNGSNELINIICQTLVSPKAHAVIGTPSFVCYAMGLKAANVPFTSVPLREMLYWNVDDLLEAVKPETKLLFLANPNNPTGTHLGKTELQRLIRELPPGVVLVVDEAYVELADAPEYVSALAMRDERERLIVLRTFSKSHGLAGLRVGYSIASPEISDYLNRVRAPFNVNVIAQEAALAALEDPEHVRRYVQFNARGRSELTARLSERGLRVAPSQANFVFVDFERDSMELHRALLGEGVIIRPMPEPVSTWQRISVGLDRENERLLEALCRVL